MYMKKIANLALYFPISLNNVSLSYILQSVLVLTSFRWCSMSVVFIISIFSFPFLELQLKDHHRPFRLRKVWAELLKKFTVVTDEVAEKGKLPLTL